MKRMFFLISKQGFQNIKNRWQLYLAYFCFLVLSFLIIFSFFGLTFNFQSAGSKILNFNYWPNYQFSYFNYSTSDNLPEKPSLPEERQVIENNDDDSFWGFYANELDGLLDQTALRWFLNRAGANRGYFEKDVNGPISLDNQEKLLAWIQEYDGNLFAKWLFEINYRSELNNPSHWTTLDPTISLNNDFGNEQFLASSYKIEDWNQAKDKTLKVWQRKDYYNEFFWTKKERLLSINDKYGVVISAKMAGIKSLSLGDNIKIQDSQGKTLNLHVSAIGVRRTRALTDSSNDIWLNPLLYNDLTSGSALVHPSFLDLIDFSSRSLRTNQEIDALNQNLFKILEKQWLKSFTDNGIPIGYQPSYKNSSVHTFATQVTIYYLLSFIICFILVLLTIVIYYIVAKNSINHQRSQIAFLKTLGLNNYWLSYYILFSICPFILLAFLLGLAFSPMVYHVFQHLTMTSISFSVPNSYLANGKMWLFLVLFALGLSAITYGLVFWQIKKQSFLKPLRKPAKIGKITKNLFVFFKIKSYNRSIILLNFTKALQLFIISFFTFLALDTTFQFTSSIKATSQTNERFFQPYKSYSAQNLEAGQVDYDPTLTIDKFLNPVNGYQPLPKVDFHDPFRVIGWLLDLWQKDNLDKYYFNQLDDFIKEDVSKTLTQVANSIKPGDVNFEKNLLQVHKNVAAKVNTYYQYFGNQETPIINFKHIIFPEKHLFSTIIPMSIDNQQTKVFVDKRWSPNLKINEAVINYVLANSLALKINDLIEVKYVAPNRQVFTKTLKVKKIETKINDDKQMLISPLLANQWNIERNAIFSNSAVPIGLKFLTLPTITPGSPGNRLSDYLDLANLNLDLPLTFSSLPLLSEAITNKTRAYTDLLIIIGIFMLILCVMVLIVVGIMFSLENARLIILLKALGYDYWSLSKPIIIFFAFNLICAYLLALLVSIVILKKSSSFLLNKMAIMTEPVFNFSTIGVTLIFAFLMSLALMLWMYRLYRQGDLSNLTLEETK